MPGFWPSVWPSASTRPDRASSSLGKPERGCYKRCTLQPPGRCSPSASPVSSPPHSAKASRERKLSGVSVAAGLVQRPRHPRRQARRPPHPCRPSALPPWAGRAAATAPPAQTPAPPPAGAAAASPAPSEELRAAQSALAGSSQPAGVRPNAGAKRARGRAPATDRPPALCSPSVARRILLPAPIPSPAPAKSRRRPSHASRWAWPCSPPMATCWRSPRSGAS